MDIAFREEAICAIVGAVGVHYALLSYDVKVRFSKLHTRMPTPFASQRRVALVDHPRRFHLHIPMGTGLLHLFKMDLFCEED